MVILTFHKTVTSIINEVELVSWSSNTNQHNTGLKPHLDTTKEELKKLVINTAFSLNIWLAFSLPAIKNDFLL